MVRQVRPVDGGFGRWAKPVPSRSATGEPSTPHTDESLTAHAGASLSPDNFTREIRVRICLVIPDTFSPCPKHRKERGPWKDTRCELVEGRRPGHAHSQRGHDRVRKSEIVRVGLPKAVQISVVSGVPWRSLVSCSQGPEPLRLSRLLCGMAPKL